MLTLLAIVLTTLIGGMTFLWLASGFATGKEDRSRPIVVTTAAAHTTCPLCGAHAPQRTDKELLALIQSRVLRETLAVARFIEHPSLQTLYFSAEDLRSAIANERN